MTDTVKGIGSLISICAADPPELGSRWKGFNAAMRFLAGEGEAGSLALAELIQELIACRSPMIKYVLNVASRETWRPVPALVAAVREAKQPQVPVSPPAAARFVPDYCFDDKVGWQASTMTLNRKYADQLLKRLG